MVIEKQINYYGTVYLKRSDRNKKILETVQIFSFQQYSSIKKRNEYLMILEKNKRFTVLESPFYFINDYMECLSDNYRNQAVAALKILFVYMELFYVDLEKMTNETASRLLDFLQGEGEIHGRNTSLLLMNRRCNNTANAYLRVFRKFIKYLGYTNNPLLQYSVNEIRGYSWNKNNISGIKKYEYDIPANRIEKIPVYITPEEFKKIRTCKMIKKEYRLLITTIVDLMMLQGLRIGEVLSLTLEDFYWDGKSYWIGLKNRATNKKWQNVKSCMNVSSESDYQSQDYKKAGFQIIYLDKTCTDDLREYINKYHPEPENKQPEDKNLKRYKEINKADTVAKYLNQNEIRHMKLNDVKFLSVDGENHYIFMNRLKAPLSANRWNQLLREVFKANDIGLDTGVRRSNLSHRFRHGFAMFLAHQLNYDSIKIRDMLRQKSIESIKVYTQLEAATLFNLQQKYVKSLFECIKERK